jgi:hypothetical protein
LRVQEVKANQPPMPTSFRPEAPILARMQTLIQRWEAAQDSRAVFLSCYCLMTVNTLNAIEQQEFGDAAWVNRLLHRFADYYFAALEADERSPASAPPVWQQAFAAARDPQATALQQLLLGVNAHINYDLVLTLTDVLSPEWAALSPEQCAQRHADHDHVNAIIARTIDAVQDQVLEPAMPVMDLIDRALGPLDELLISRLIAGWREKVWRYATLLLDADETARAAVVREVEEEALRIGQMIHGGSARRPATEFAG